MHCRVCKQYIRNGARKCHHCGSVFGWRKIANRTSLFAGLFVTLITAITVSNPFFIKLFKGDYTKIDFMIVESSPQKTVVAINNSGNSPAGIKRIYAQVYVEDPDPYTWHFNKVTSIQTIDPGKTITITAQPKNGQAPVKEDPIYNFDIVTTECRINLDIVELDEKEYTYSEDFKCYGASFGHNETLF